MVRVNKFSQSELNSNSSKPAILLLHGHLDSSDTWILNEHKSIAFILADAGYDVYMGNMRGNKYSMGHTTLYYRRSSLYWYNTVPDLQGKYDVPAFIKGIQNTSNVETVSLIGHSMGSRNILMNLDLEGPYYKQNVNFVTLLSPFAALEGSTFINLVLIYGNNLIDDLRPEGLHIYRSFKNPGVIPYGFKMVCGYASFVCDF